MRPCFLQKVTLTLCVSISLFKRMLTLKPRFVFVKEHNMLSAVQPLFDAERILLPSILIESMKFKLAPYRLTTKSDRANHVLKYPRTVDSINDFANSYLQASRDSKCSAKHEKAYCVRCLTSVH